MSIMMYIASKRFCNQNYFSLESDDDQDNNDENNDDEDVLKFKCNICHIGYQYNSWYSRHMSTHNPGLFVCKYCPKSFKRKDTLNEHTYIHLGGRSFKCNECIRQY